MEEIHDKVLPAFIDWSENQDDDKVMTREAVWTLDDMMSFAQFYKNNINY